MLEARLQSETAQDGATQTWDVAVVGAGYVGVPLAHTLAAAGRSVLLIDIADEVVAGLNRGESHIRDVPTDELKPLVQQGRIRATTEFVAGSMRVTAPSLCEIQSAPAPNAIPSGPSDWPTGIVAAAWFVAGSTRVIVPPRQSAVQTEPAPATTPIGPTPTGTSADTAFVAWSIRTTALRSKLVTQAEPSAYATPIGWPATGIRAWRRGGAATAWTPATRAKMQATAAARARRVTTTLRDITTRLS